jgi:hypothetical protein
MKALNPVNTVKVKFLRTYTVNDEEAFRYEEGKVYEMSEASARHFVNREAAKVVASGTAVLPEVTGKRVMAPEQAAMAPPETATRATGTRK